MITVVPVQEKCQFHRLLVQANQTLQQVSMVLSNQVPGHMRIEGNLSPLIFGTLINTSKVIGMQRKHAMVKNSGIKSRTDPPVTMSQPFLKAAQEN